MEWANIGLFLNNYGVFIWLIVMFIIIIGLGIADYSNKDNFTKDTSEEKTVIVLLIFAWPIVIIIFLVYYSIYYIVHIPFYIGKFIGYLFYNKSNLYFGLRIWLRKKFKQGKAK
jgi:hypothetical protein